jgi:hypothetical protein
MIFKACQGHSRRRGVTSLTLGCILVPSVSLQHTASKGGIWEAADNAFAH